MPEVELEPPIPFGIDANTGMPLPGIGKAELESFASSPTSAPSGEEAILERRAGASNESFAVIGEIDGNDLSQAGWGVILGKDVSADVRKALEPLFEHRRVESDNALFKVFEGDAAPRAGETASKWLGRHNVALHVVDPALGVPFYLLIVGSPEAIPFDFQYGLDIYFAVGRLHFDTPEEYRRYADSVIAYETASRPPTTRQAAVFATAHDFDRATQLFTTKVARPLVYGDGLITPLGRRQKFALRPFIGEQATKRSLANILSGTIEGGPPSVLFSGTHGLCLKSGDSRLRNLQGAIVCQDWEGFGRIKEAECFSAHDLPANASMHGLIHVLFACYGAGCPEVDSFRRSEGTPRQIAPAPLIARLPQAMLGRNNGALAVIGHVDRAWAYSFISEKGGAQTQGFRDVIGRLMRGERAGMAMDQYNVRWAALSTELSDTLNTISHGEVISDTELANRWVARDDARNYIVFGDPAVRLRVEAMPEPT